MEIWNINGLLDKAVKRFGNLTAQEICDKIAEFASANDDSSFVEAKLALADRLNAMSEDEITALENYSRKKEENGFSEYKYVVQAIAVKRLDSIIDKLMEQ